jgi:hypothetical protein
MRLGTTSAPITPRRTPLTPAAALRFVISFGVVSLFADMTYEGMRSISGPFLALLGASGSACTRPSIKAAR